MAVPSPGPAWGPPRYVADRVTGFAPQSPSCSSLSPASLPDKKRRSPLMELPGSEGRTAERTSSCPVITAPDSFPRELVLTRVTSQPGPDTRASLGAQIFPGGKIKDPAPLKRQEFGL